MNIFLIGYRGTGKNAVGRALAERLGMQFIDTDRLIEEKAGMPIQEIFEKHGEPRFRAIESEAIKEASANEGRVVATGGGAPMRKENAEALKASGIVVLLECSPEVIYKRIKGDRHRPALTGIGSEFEEIKFMLAKRNPTYNSLADFVSDTTSKSIKENVDEIILFLKGKGELK